MAMTPGPDPLLNRAMLELLAEADRRWAQVAPRVRARAMRAGGRREGVAVAVRGEALQGPVTVAGAVLVAELARAVAGLPGTRLRDVQLEVGAGDPADLVGVTLVVAALLSGTAPTAAEPEPLQQQGSRLAAVAAARLRELLGPALPEPVEELVAVRFEDVAAPPDQPSPSPDQPQR